MTVESLDQAVAAPGYLRGQITQPKTGVLKVPTNIIQTVPGAKVLYYQTRAEHLSRIDLYAQIEGLFAGNPPYNPADLAKNKLSHIANFNNLKARSIYERSATAYWNLNNEANSLIKFVIRPGKWMNQYDIRESKETKQAPDPQLAEWAETMARHWTTVVRSWPAFTVVENTNASQIVKFGYSPKLWPDERDWRYRTVEVSRFFVEDQAQTNTDLLTYVMVETIFTSQELYQMWEQFQGKEFFKADGSWDYATCPWNMTELSSLMLWVANQFAKTDFTFMDMMDIQQRLQNRDLTFNAIFSDSIRIVSLFYQEYDGEVSHYMFHPRYDTGNFLFFADRQYKRLEEGVLIYTASPGEFTIHSNRGLGHKIFSSSQASMQLDCSIVDMARMSATPIVRGISTGSKDFEAIRFYSGVPTNIGTAEFVENTLGANLQNLIGVSGYIQSNIENNLSNSNDNPGLPDKDTGSIAPSQARMEAYREFAIPKNSINHYYSYQDRCYTNMTVKMLNSKPTYPGHEYVERWKDLCIEDGVPKEIFSPANPGIDGMPAHLSCRATRVTGDGSQVAKLMGLQELQAVAPDFGPEQARSYQREYVLTTMGPEYLDEFGPTDAPDETAGGASLAGVENAVMRMGESPVFSQDNEHKAHFTTHMALATDTIQRIQQQQMDPVEANKIFQVLIPHMGEHLQILSKSIFAQKYVQQVKKSWDQVQQYATLNAHNAAKQEQAAIKAQQEQQQKQDQLLSDEALKSLQVHSDINRKDMQATSKENRATEQSHTKAELDREKVTTQAANQRLKIQLEHSNNQQKTLQEQDAAVASTPLPQLRQDLAKINGTDPSPYNIEIPKVNPTGGTQ